MMAIKRSALTIFKRLHDEGLKGSQTTVVDDLCVQKKHTQEECVQSSAVDIKLVTKELLTSDRQQTEQTDKVRVMKRIKVNRRRCRRRFSEVMIAQ